MRQPAQHSSFLQALRRRAPTQHSVAVSSARPCASQRGTQYAFRFRLIGPCGLALCPAAEKQKVSQRLQCHSDLTVPLQCPNSAPTVP